MGSVAKMALIVAAGLAHGATTPKHAYAQDSGFVAWPRELASRAPAVADGIAREFGERPRMIAFGGRDTIQILFWNPKIWQDDMESKVLPETSLPIVRGATRDVAAYVWTTFGRDAGVNVVRVAFVRVVHDSKYINPTHEAPAQEVSALFSRQMLETRQLPMLATALREGGAWPPAFQKWLDSSRAARQAKAKENPSGAYNPRDAFVRGPQKLAPRGLALVDSIERDFGDRPRELAFTGKDTIEVTFWNPSFWRRDMESKEFPQASLPLARKAAERVGGFVWRKYGRDAGIDVVRVTFVRMRRVRTTVATRDVPVQEVTGEFVRRQLVTGAPQLVSLTLTQR
ncbi:MAG TPA: hypothetical protein VGJ18_18610 [Gemmatimonadaceae bacterium]|jgi:hypothetical protein